MEYLIASEDTAIIEQMSSFFFIIMYGNKLLAKWHIELFRDKVRCLNCVVCQFDDVKPHGHLLMYVNFESSIQLGFTTQRTKC